MFSVHFNTTVCLTSCVFAFGLQKKNLILGKIPVLLMLLILLHIIFFYEDFMGMCRIQSIKQLFVPEIHKTCKAFGNSTQVIVTKYVSRKLLDSVTLDTIINEESRLE